MFALPAHLKPLIAHKTQTGRAFVSRALAQFLGNALSLFAGLKTGWHSVPHNPLALHPPRFSLVKVLSAFHRSDSVGELLLYLPGL